MVPPPLHSTARAEEPERLSVGTATPLADAANLAMTKPTMSKLVAKLAAARTGGESARVDKLLVRLAKRAKIEHKQAAAAGSWGGPLIPESGAIRSA